MTSVRPRAASHPWIELDGAIIRVTMPEWVTLQKIDEYETALIALQKTLVGPRAVVTDTRPLAPINSVLRRRFAEVIPRTSEFHQYCAASAVIVSNPFFKGALTAVHWLSPPPFPQRAFSRPEAAETWVSVLLDRARRGRAKRVGE